MKEEFQITSIYSKNYREPNGYNLFHASSFEISLSGSIINLVHSTAFVFLAMFYANSVETVDKFAWCRKSSPMGYNKTSFYYINLSNLNFLFSYMWVTCDICTLGLFSGLFRKSCNNSINFFGWSLNFSEALLELFPLWFDVLGLLAYLSCLVPAGDLKQRFAETSRQYNYVQYCIVFVSILTAVSVKKK